MNSSINGQCRFVTAGLALLILAAFANRTAAADETKKCLVDGHLKAATKVVLISGRNAAVNSQQAKLSAALARFGLGSIKVEPIEVDEFHPDLIMQQLRTGKQLDNTVMVTLSGIVAHALTQALPDGPIIFASLDDPVEAGIVSSLSARKQNATGISYAIDLERKALEHLKLAFPSIKSVGVVLDEHSAKRPVFQRLSRDSDHRLGVRVETFIAETPAALSRILSSPAGRHIDAWYLPETAVVLRHEDSTLNAFAGLRKPTLFGHPSLLKKGAVMVFGAEFSNLWEEVAQMVKLVCAGTPAREIPIVRPHRIFLGASAANAKRQGIEINPRIFKLATIVD